MRVDLLGPHASILAAQCMCAVEGLLNLELLGPALHIDNDNAQGTQISTFESMHIIKKGTGIQPESGVLNWTCNPVLHPTQ
jgi:hypothetical protein